MESAIFTFLKASGPFFALAGGVFYAGATFQRLKNLERMVAQLLKNSSELHGRITAVENRVATLEGRLIKNKN